MQLVLAKASKLALSTVVSQPRVTTCPKTAPTVTCARSALKFSAEMPISGIVSPLEKKRVVADGRKALASIDAALAIIESRAEAAAAEIWDEPIKLVGEVGGRARQLSDARDKNTPGHDYWQAVADAAMRLETTLKDTKANKYGDIPYNRLNADIDAFRTAVEDVARDQQ